VFAGTPAGCRILHKQTLSLLFAVITTWLTDTGQTERQTEMGRKRERQIITVY